MEQNFKIDESEVTRAIVSSYMEEFLDLIETDVVIVGSGPAGTVAAKTLAENGVKTLIIERNIKPGGGMLLGGMLMNKMVVEAPADRLLREVGVKSMKEYRKGVYIMDAYEASTKLLAAAFDAGAKMLNAIDCTDVVYRKEGICGVVVNWHMVKEYPSWVTCVDPLALKCKVVIDATGHEASIAAIAAKKLGFNIVGHEGSMWVEQGEKATISNTKEVYPGLIVCGMAANSVDGLPRMGPIFGAMFLSGLKAAKLAMEKIGRNEVVVEN